MGSDDELAIAEWLGRKGALGIIAQIDRDEGNTKTELKALVHVDDDTAGKRIRTAYEKLDLLEEKSLVSDHGNDERRALTNRGKALRSKLDEMGLITAYQEFFEAFQAVKNGRKDAVEAIEGDEITDPEWPYEDYYEPQTPSDLTHR